jgi:5-deoxy-D-glucuronate isomerase
VSSFNIINIADGDPVDLGEHLAGGWGPSRILDLGTGDSHDFDAADDEICTFVISGQGTVAMGEHVTRFDTGTGATLMRGSVATVTAEAPMQLFATWLTRS